MTNITGIILAGGKAQRLGRNKALAELGGKPVIERVVATLEKCCTEIVISANDPAPYRNYSQHIVADIFPGFGVLAGIHSALDAMKTDRAFVVACDMPFLNEALIGHMINLPGSWDALVPKWLGEFEPLHAVYSKACIGPIVKQIKSGQRRVINFYDDIKLETVDDDVVRRFDPDGLSFFNINTETDLKRAAEIARSRG